MSHFPYDSTLADVRYAVDDAVDLAVVLALDERIRLVPASSVILALSGEPQKPESKKNLERLVAAGAHIRSAGGPDILTVLDEQSRAAGKKGLLILAFATHGFTRDGTQYLLTATSILRHHEGVISESEVRDVASQSEAARSLIFVDACRERLSDGQRSGGADAQSAAGLLQAMKDVNGQIVLSAAAAGQYAYDDDDRRNGVFTAAVIDGLHCQAADERGMITVDSLSSFVEQHVLSWIRKHRNARTTRATQVSFEGNTKSMPLGQCRRVVTPAQVKQSSPAATGSIAVVILDERGQAVPQLAAAANEVIRESGYEPVSLRDRKESLQYLASGHGLLQSQHLPKTCRAVFAGVATISAAAESIATLDNMNVTRIRLRFYLIESNSRAIASSFESEARGGGFTKESSEMQAWERAAATLRTEMRKMKWNELSATP